MSYLLDFYRENFKKYPSHALFVRIISFFSNAVRSYRESIYCKRALKHFMSIPWFCRSSDLNDALQFIRKHGWAMIPMKYRFEYDEDGLFEVCWDNEHMRYFVLCEGKHIYMKTGMTREETSFLFKSLLIEQDIRSPHRYTSPDNHMIGVKNEMTFLHPHRRGLSVAKGDIVLDIGAAEGYFALSVLPYAKRVFLFECDLEWVEALKLTFRENADKVVIVSKKVTSTLPTRKDK